jgi:hydrogenase maturation protein HypF
LDRGRYKEAKIHITGRVQGVGFRPFIYRKAVERGLTGYVINLGDAGVEVIVEGLKENIESFLTAVEREAPKVSGIEEISVHYNPFKNRFNEFKIERSQHRGRTASGLFPPDIGICSKCVKDIEQEGSRWFEYPFTACAWCGPRFTGVKALPYDRERTHMNDFPLCPSCVDEYYDPLDRRFDAQGITCKICGPKMNIYTPEGRLIDTKDVFETASDLLLSGSILAIKGIGGIHITSLADENEITKKLRERKARPRQPFAVMAPNIEMVESFATLDQNELSFLTSWRKPIVLVKERKGTLSPLVAPGLDRIGVMLPYSGIHHMLFKKLDVPALIMTSGNKPSLPMAITNEQAFKELDGMVDFLLLHDRDILNRADDSVLRVIDNIPAFIRRSRGYVPDPIPIPFKRGLAYALGTELRNAAAIISSGKCYTTQYLGDITNLESLEFEKKAIETLKKLLNITREPDVISCDLHPQYITSQYGEEISQEMDVPLVRSQHHHAHIVSVAAEHDISPHENIIGIALDGAGYGSDGQIWGGEVLITNYEFFERKGHLEYIPMPGGDLCTYYPYRMLISALTTVTSNQNIRDITKNHIEDALPYGETELEIILNQAKRDSILKTSSSGRFLDSIAAIIDLVYERTYEGEPAMKLESIATKGDPENIQIKPSIKKKNNKYTLQTAEILLNLLKNKNSYKKQDIAIFGQKYLIHGMAEITRMISEDQGIKKVALSGGVFVNDYITTTLSSILKENGLTVYRQLYVPPGDGGTALGQGCIGISKIM